MQREQEERFDYAAEFGSQYHGARKLPNRAEEWISRVRAAKVAPFVAPSDRVLEYGVGFGWNLWKIQCKEKVGFDVTPELRPAVESKHIRFESRQEAIESAHYDVVLCHHVLEHLRSPLACLHELKQFLAARGRLLLFVPFERERKYGRYRANDKAHHLYSWTPASFARLLTRAGLRVSSIRLQRFRFDRIAAVAANRLKGGFGLYCLLRQLGLLVLPEYEIAVVAENEK